MFRDCRQPASCSGNRFYFEDGVLHVIWVRTTIVCSRIVHGIVPVSLAMSSIRLQWLLVQFCSRGSRGSDYGSS